MTSSSFRRVSWCASALLLCFALLCIVSRFFIALLCFAVGTESEEENRKRSKGRLGGVQNDSKTLPESSQNPPKMAAGSLPGSLRRPLGAIWRRRWLPGALRGPSEGVPGASWVIRNTRKNTRNYKFRLKLARKNLKTRLRSAQGSRKE